MLLLAVPAVVLHSGLTPPFRRHVSLFTARPATTCHRQPPRARLPARLHPAGRPAESQPRTTPHWHVAVPSVAPARVGRPGRWGPPFLCPASAGGRARTPVALQAAHFPVAEVASMPRPDDWRSGSVRLGAPGEKRRLHCADGFFCP
jgi:hypothetical protein